MAFATRAYSTFYDQLDGKQVEILIQSDGFSGSVQNMVMAGTPFTIRRGAGNTDKYTPVRGSECTINIVVGQSDDYTWLYTTNDRTLKVQINYDGDTYWVGFVLSDQYEEELAPVRILTVTASDQLGLLDKQDFTFGSPATSPTGRDTGIAIIAKVLTKTGLNIDFATFNPLFAFEMTNLGVPVGDDPFALAEYDQDLFINDDLTPYDCRTVLENILSPFLCQVFQANGNWFINRIPNTNGDNKDYTVYTTAGSVTDTYNIDHLKTGLVMTAGSTLKLSSGWKRREFTADYGLLPSIIPSFSLPDRAFTADSPAEITGWTNTGEWRRRFVAGKGNLLQAYTSGRYIADVPVGTTSSRHIKLPAFDVTTADTFELSIDCGMQKEHFGFSPKCRVEILLNTGTWGPDPFDYMSYDESSGTWEPGIGYEVTSINFPSVSSMADLVTQKVTIPSPPASGQLMIQISDPYRASLSTNDGYFWFTNVVMTAQIDTATDRVSTETFIATFDKDTNYQPDAITFRLTDTVGDDALLPLYKGIVTVSGDPSTQWAWDLNSPTWMPLLPYSGALTESVIVDSWAQQYATPNKILNASMIGIMPMYQMPVIGGVTYLPTDIEIDLKHGTISGSFIELKAENEGSGAYTIELKNRGNQDTGILYTSGLPATPGGEDGELQFGTSGKFSGTTGITFDGTRIKSGTLPLIEYRAGVATTTNEASSVPFFTPFVVGDDYAILPIWGLTANGDTVNITPYGLDENGFYVPATSEDCTFTYLAIVKR